MQTGFHLAFTTQAVVAFDITGDSRAVGYVAFAQGAALLLTTPLAGALADRFAKRLLVASELMLALTALALSILIFADAITIVFVAAGGLMLGVGISTFWPAITASMVGATIPTQRANGAGLFQVAVQMTRASAPFVAAALLSIEAVGSGGTYLIVALVYVTVLITAAIAPSAANPTPAVETRDSLWREVRLGVKYVTSNRQLFEVMVSFVVVITLGFSILVLLPAFTKDVLGAGSAGFGIMFGFNAIGALLASMFTASLGGSTKVWFLLLVFGVGFGLSLALTGLMPSFVLAVVTMLFAGFFGGGYQTLITARMLHLSESAYFGRVMAITSIGWSFTNLASLVVGVSADLAGERAVLVAIGLSLALASLLLAFWTRARVSGVEPAAAAVG